MKFDIPKHPDMRTATRVITSKQAVKDMQNEQAKQAKEKELAKAKE